MLEKIKTPKDIQKLDVPELELLAKDVRGRIIDVTAKNGGHIAPSLGATDLTIALLKIFDPLQDRIVWDVGHQSYAWKILTERNDRFDTLRQKDGLSGFNNISESKYDAFGVGHSSTSISSALGIAAAKSLQKKKGRSIAVIGDGALTGGIAFEGLNNAGHLQKNLIVILNDNNMSISKNVGALQSYLANILVSRSYNALKGKVWDILHRFPGRVRRKLISGSQKFEENIINFFVPNVIFEDLGFKYVGPIDGHDMQKLTTILDKAKSNMTGPILIHVVTQKGRGYHPAEEDAPKFHGLGPFDLKTGKCVSKKGVSYSNVYGDTLCQLAAENENIVAITAAMTGGTGLTGFAEKFPERLFDVGIAEQHGVTFAAGMATQGIKPFVTIYSTFLQRAFDQLIHDVALQKLPLVFGLDRAGLVGEDGATHHGAFDLSYLNLIPNLVIMAPADGLELAKMMRFAADYQAGPVAIRYPRGSARICDRKAPVIELGKFETLIDGEEIVVMGIGKAFEDADVLQEMLTEKFPDKKIGLINPRFMKPLDRAKLDELKNKTKIIITLEDNSLPGGFGDVVSSYLGNSNTTVYSYGLPDHFVTHATVAELREMLKLTPEHIFEDLKDKI